MVTNPALIFPSFYYVFGAGLSIFLLGKSRTIIVEGNGTIRLCLIYLEDTMKELIFSNLLRLTWFQT